MSSSTEMMVWTPSEASREWARAYRRAKRRERRWYWGIGGGFVGLFLVAFAVLTLHDPPEKADAQDVLTPASSTTTFIPPPPVELVPETVPTSVAPGWLTFRVVVPGYDGLGKIVTDGQHAKARILPGDVGRSVIALPADPRQAATVIVNGEPWVVFARGSVPSDGLATVTGPFPEEATVYVVSSLPGDSRPFVEARR